MKLIAKIDGMHCNGCKTTLERELNDSKIVNNASVDLEKNLAIIEVDEKVKIKTIEKIIKKAGFKCIEVYEDK